MRSNDARTLYEFRIRGAIREDAAVAFYGMDVMKETTYVAEVPDLEALDGFLDRIQSVGLELVDLRRFGDARRRGPSAVS